MIKVNLRQAMVEYARRTGKRTTYAEIANATGLSKATLEALGSRNDYNTTLATIDLLCQHLRCDIATLLEYQLTTTEGQEGDANKN